MICNAADEAAAHRAWLARVPSHHQAVADAAMEAGWEIDLYRNGGWSLIEGDLVARVRADGAVLVCRWVADGWSAACVEVECMLAHAALDPAQWRLVAERPRG